MEPNDKETNEPTGRATYSPEDNKIRLYIGRVPREEYNKLRAAGWVTLHKQREAGGGDFAAIWTPGRRDTALEYAAIIEDEDMGPAERAADRAERFGVYRDKRTDDATGHADRFDAGPSAHGFQSEARAERAAARHDRIAGRAVDAWSKAEYWQRRTAGVISHALHRSSPGVRMGRIKEIEADMRREEKTRAENAERVERWRTIAAMTDPEKQTAMAETFSGFGYGRDGYKHPRTGKMGSLWDFLRDDATDRLTGAEGAALYLASHTDPLTQAWEETRLADWVNHYRLRLAYENQMIEAQGGRAAFVEMVVGGWIGERQIRKVNKSNATGRVVSVEVMGTRTRYNEDNKSETRAVPVLVNVERLPADSYRAPTAEELAAHLASRKAEKAAAPKKESCPLVNMTDADAERLQAIWNERGKANHLAQQGKYGADFAPAVVRRITQANYSSASGGYYSSTGTRGLCRNAELRDRDSNLYVREEVARAARIGKPVCMIRVTSGGSGYHTPESIIVLTDKPQKALTAAVWAAANPVVAEIAAAITQAFP